MKGLMQVFISISAGGLRMHTLGIKAEDNGQHPHWLRQYERCLGVEQLNPLVQELEWRGFKKQPSTGYLLIYALYIDEKALPEAT